IGKAGATLVINGHTPSKMEEALASYRAAGLTAYGYLFDVTDAQQVQQNIAQIEQEVGPISILVNNAGIIKRIPALEMDEADFRQVLDVDLTAPFIVSKHVARYMV